MHNALVAGAVIDALAARADALAVGADALAAGAVGAVIDALVVGADALAVGAARALDSAKPKRARVKAESLFMLSKGDNKDNARVINAKNLNLKANNIGRIVNIEDKDKDKDKDKKEEEEKEDIHNSSAKKLAKRLKLRILRILLLLPKDLIINV
ncbi:hypothetical protein K504DRAFT_452772 [Pleomassaria siparia CBS 279.74]|uniref:Uncharacterized protein n=1 Tax=Pleomassaria siparia CBS 279.74 TaxID=1314801 RepID=A0A6G1KIE8_9PLEO|nr:hypothetical protein K504DRAFT_452772 [Pleomassaria siparia CBS 279.74]